MVRFDEAESPQKDRRAAERRQGTRRQSPSTCVDVTRLEHENLCGQVAEVLRMLHRIEHELHLHGRRLSVLERDIEQIVKGAQRAS